MVTAPNVKTQAAGLNCSSCGASITLSTAGWAVTVVCATCGAVLDAQDPNLRILEQQQRQILVQPRIPLGTRGNWKGVVREVVGFQQQTISVEGEQFSWTEYVCFNPYHGFMYLSEYQGHWNVIEKLHKRPDADPAAMQPISFEGKQFKHFQSATAATTFALGEFPWEVNMGDTVRAHDYVSPPYLLSAESTDAETTWSMGTYTDPEALGRAFGLGGNLRTPAGVFANQPNPHHVSARTIGRAYKFCLLALFAMLAVNIALARRETVFNGKFTYDVSRGDTAAFVTDPFELNGRTSNVDVRINTDLENNWLFFGLALIDENTGQAFDVGREVSYYHGRDSDGSWSEGSRGDHFKLGSVPSGKYILRVGAEQSDVAAPDPSAQPVVAYSITMKRDVPSYAFYVLAFFALSIPALLSLAPAASFERQRWAESDHAPVSVSSSSDDDE